MDIPDEVIESIRCCAEGYPRFAEDELRVVVSDIARAAQVAVLREMADKMLTVYAASMPSASVQAVAFRSAAAELRGKANELERGE
jgi:hypothetical protein